MHFTTPSLLALVSLFAAVLADVHMFNAPLASTSSLEQPTWVRPPQIARREHRQTRKLRKGYKLAPLTTAQCPSGQTPCRYSKRGGFECVDLSYELEHCGSCGMSCNDLQGVGSVACSAGTCFVGSCDAFHQLRGGRCV